MCKTEAQADFEKSMKRIAEAEDTLLTKLFGFVPKVPGAMITKRSTYIKAMKEVEQEYNLVEGDPDMVLFVLEQLARTPRIENDKEGR